ncbi:uncharacterized protein LOC123718741 [Pieris brassicae]|uniref:uncharacterized protein LOC123718741 n=3 Tax=Pieris brassicae TaxID=7116 RepID=UPI001E65F0D8|nr:uncharacterized protein LOC123718741 [Pieris brassicae]
MDRETKHTNQQKAASTDAPKTNINRVASQDVLRCKSPVTRYSDAPISQTDAPNRAAFEAPKERAAAEEAPNRDAPLTVPTPMVSHTPPHKDASTVAARLTASVEQKIATPKDDTAMSASIGGASEARSMRKTEAATMSTSSAQTSTMDMSALKSAIQESTPRMVLSSSKRRRLRKAKRATEQQQLITGSQRIPENPGTAPAVTTTAGRGKRAPKPTGSSAALKPIGSRCGKGPRGGYQTKNPNQTKQQTKGQKRDRPEETVTPTGESKRVKPNKLRLESGTSASYAEAAASYKANELCVAVMTEPFIDMTQEQADNIRLQIEGKIQDELMADLEATLATEPNDIRFRGRAHFSDGVLKTWCEDTYTLGWLTGACDVINNPIPDTKLVVRPQSDIPKKVPCLLHVPEFTGSTETLRKLITRQNRHLNIRSWTLTHERRTQDPTGVSLFLRVPEYEISKIKAHERRIYYLMGNIYIRILEKDEPSVVAAATVTTASTSGTGSSGPKPPSSTTEIAAVAEETGGSEFSDSCLRSSP